MKTITWVNTGPSTLGHPQMEGSAPRGMGDTCSDLDPHGQLRQGHDVALQVQSPISPLDLDSARGTTGMGFQSQPELVGSRPHLI